MRLAAITAALAASAALTSSSAHAQSVNQFLSAARQGAAPRIEAAGPAGQDGPLIGGATEGQFIALLQQLPTEPERYAAIMDLPDAAFGRVSSRGLEWFFYLTDPGRHASIIGKVPASSWQQFNYYDFQRVLGRLDNDRWATVWGKIPASVWQGIEVRQFEYTTRSPRPTLRAIEATPAAFWARLGSAEVSQLMGLIPEHRAAILAAWTRAQR